MQEKTIVEKLTEYNKAYRNGNPIVTDSDYDKLLDKLPQNHWYRHKVEPEDWSELQENMFKHPKPMLSTQKAKTDEEVLKWIRKVKGCCNSDTLIRVTAKLDGLAGNYYPNGTLVTRGNGFKGNIVTSAFTKGVINLTGDFGPGELVMEKEYFEKYLKNDFSHPRNVVVGIVMSKIVNPKVQKALDDGVVHFAHYDSINSVIVSLHEFEMNYRKIEHYIRNETIYPIDGVVIEVYDDDIKRIIGSTDHHHNYMIALKPKDEECVTTIINRVWQTGRTGKLTPVLNVEATELDGAIIRRVTAHNAKKVVEDRLSDGTIISIIRSGGVIPKLERVIEHKKDENFYDLIPDYCDSCGTVLEWNKTNTDLICTAGYMCDAQVENKLVHFFNTIGNIDGFGPSTIEKIVESGCYSLDMIYELKISDFVDIGFGNKTSFNLHEELKRSLRVEIEDWRLLAAFGIISLGKGNSKKLLKHYAIQDVFYLDVIHLKDIDGFGQINSVNISEGLYNLRKSYKDLMDKFNVSYTVLKEDEEEKEETAITGKVIVFTGKMAFPRNKMEEHAEKLGAIIGKSVNSKTDILVTGDKVGASKIKKAEQFKVKVMPVDEYNVYIDNEQ